MKRFFCLALSILSIFSAVFFCACNGSGNASQSYAVHRDNANVKVKKGVGVSRYNNQAGAQKLTNLNLGWYYNWGYTDPLNGSGAAGEYVPMVWGEAQVNDTALNYIKNGYDTGKFKYLLTFNEPDLAEQSNITVDRAIELWPRLEALGIPLSSPCPSSYNTTKPYNWLDDFMKKAKEKNYRVDFIAVHIYQDFSTSGIENKMKSDILEKLYQKYQLPIWVTEFGAIDIRYWGTGTYTNACNETNAKKYVTNSTKVLEKLGYVERYAWFLDNYTETIDEEPYKTGAGVRPYEGKFSSLYRNDNTISAVGAIYKNVSSLVPLYVDGLTLPKGKLNTNYSFSVLASGGKGNYVFSATGLPRGLTMDGGGKITGSPKTGGEYSVKVTVRDDGGQSIYRDYTLIVN